MNPACQSWWEKTSNLPAIGEETKAVLLQFKSVTHPLLQVLDAVRWRGRHLTFTPEAGHWKCESLVVHAVSLFLARTSDCRYRTHAFTKHVLRKTTRGVGESKRFLAPRHRGIQRSSFEGQDSELTRPTPFTVYVKVMYDSTPECRSSVTVQNEFLFVGKPKALKPLHHDHLSTQKCSHMREVSSKLLQPWHVLFGRSSIPSKCVRCDHFVAVLELHVEGFWLRQRQPVHVLVDLPVPSFWV